MPRYAFSTPVGWIKTRLSATQEGVSLRAPEPPNSDAGAVFLLMDPVAPFGTLPQQLVLMARQGTLETDVLRISEPKVLASGAFPAAVLAVWTRVAGHEEGRMFSLFDAGHERLPVVFIGGRAALPKYQEALDLVLTSIRPWTKDDDLNEHWVE